MVRFTIPVTLRDEMVAPVTASIALGGWLLPFVYHQRRTGFFSYKLIAPYGKNDFISQPRSLFLLQNKEPRDGICAGIETDDYFDLIGVTLTAGLDHPTGQFAFMGHAEQIVVDGFRSFLIVTVPGVISTDAFWLVSLAGGRCAPHTSSGTRSRVSFNLLAAMTPLRLT